MLGASVRYQEVLRFGGPRHPSPAPRSESSRRTDTRSPGGNRAKLPIIGLRGGGVVDRFASYPSRGIPIGNLTSQLFANVYLDGLDHYAKEGLQLPYYIRYADDVVILHEDSEALAALLMPIRAWLWGERRLRLHPRKITIRKLSWGIDFLGYVTLPRYRVSRTKTKRRMLVLVNVRNLSSYLGLLRHCRGMKLGRQIVRLSLASSDRADHVLG